MCVHKTDCHFLPMSVLQLMKELIKVSDKFLLFYLLTLVIKHASIFEVAWRYNGVTDLVDVMG